MTLELAKIWEVYCDSSECSETLNSECGLNKDNSVKYFEENGWLKVKNKWYCPVCVKSGKVPIEKCKKCKGTGNTPDGIEHCSHCKGRGWEP